MRRRCRLRRRNRISRYRWRALCRNVSPIPSIQLNYTDTTKTLHQHDQNSTPTRPKRYRDTTKVLQGMNSSLSPIKFSSIPYNVEVRPQQRKSQSPIAQEYCPILMMLYTKRRECISKQTHSLNLIIEYVRILVVFRTKLTNYFTSAPHLALAQCFEFLLETYAIVWL